MPVSVADLTAAVARRLDGRIAGGTPLGPLVAELLDELAPEVDAAGRRSLATRTMAEITGLGPLQPLLDDPTVTDIMVNGPAGTWVERAGSLERVEPPLDAPTIRRIIDRAIAPLGLRIDRASPAVDARLPGGSRLHAVLPPIAVDGPYVTIRRHVVRVLTVEDMADADAARTLRRAVTDRRTILVCGATGAGKTTLLNALGGAVPPDERVVTIEDAAELALPGPHVVRLEARPPAADGAGGVSVRDLVRQSLRMRPDRFVIGEVRGPEALDMLGALLTGHRGSMATVHATSAADALLRLETLALSAGTGLPLGALHRQLCAALDLVVTVARDGARRRVVELCTVADDGTGRPLAVPTAAAGRS